MCVSSKEKTRRVCVRTPNVCDRETLDFVCDLDCIYKQITLYSPALITRQLQITVKINHLFKHNLREKKKLN